MHTHHAGAVFALWAVSGDAQDLFLASNVAAPSPGPTDMCAEMTDTNCAGSDWRDGGSVNTSAACCDLCTSGDNVYLCAAWTWDPADGSCLMKYNCHGLRAETGKIAGAILAPPEPPSPPSPIPPQVPPPGGKIPYVVLKNAALAGTMYPMTGLGIRGPGYKLGQVQECWHYPGCCTEDYCPAVNATRDWLKLGGWRIDTGYPFGDSGGHETRDGPTCGGGWQPPPQGSEHLQLGVGGHLCDPHGTRQGMEQSEVPREQMFVTIKSGSSGPMQELDKGDAQAENQRFWLGLRYVDLYLMHEGDLGSSGHSPSGFCAYPTTAACRIRVFKSCLDWLDKGKTRACGVANWEVEWLQELKDANVTLPAVVQVKFHLHQSLATPRIKAIKDFCDNNDIVFNGYSPLGRADWTVFGPEEGGAPTLFDEPVVTEIAERVGRSPAQVILRWNAQQGIPTNPRSMNLVHMRENMDVFDWELSAEDMRHLSNMPQCTTVRGNAFMEGDPSGLGHDNMIGPTLHC